MARSRRKIYGGLVGVGVLVLLADRLILSNVRPESVQAGLQGIDPEPSNSTSSAEARPAVSHGPGGAPNAVIIPQKPFPRDVSSWDPQSTMRDLFVPSNGDPSGDSDSTFRGLSFEEARRRADRARFVQSHRLNGILNVQRLKIAVIDGRWMQSGERLDGCTLIRIEGTDVVFECLDGETHLTVTGTSRTLSD